MNMLAGLSFQNGKPSRTRASEHINDAVLDTTSGKPLPLNKARIQDYE
jgi:hypothetical protein